MRLSPQGRLCLCSGPLRVPWQMGVKLTTSKLRACPKWCSPAPAPAHLPSSGGPALCSLVTMGDGTLTPGCPGQLKRPLRVQLVSIGPLCKPVESSSKATLPTPQCAASIPTLPLPTPPEGHLLASPCLPLPNGGSVNTAGPSGGLGEMKQSGSVPAHTGIPANVSVFIFLSWDRGGT